MKNVLNRPETFSTDSTTSNHRSTLGRRKRKVLGNWKLHSQHNFPSPTACSSSYTDIDVIYSLDRAIFFVFSLAKDNQSTSLTRASSTRKNDGAKRKSDKRRTKLNERTNKVESINFAKLNSSEALEQLQVLSGNDSMIS